MDGILQHAIAVARLAGDTIRELRDSGRFEISEKHGHELLTSADLAANRVIKAELGRLHPDHAYLSEEEPLPERLDVTRPTWIVDPIDGTVGYAHHHYQVAVSIAYAVADRVEIGVVHNPFLDETFAASRGGGATLNGRPIRAGRATVLADSVIGTGIPHNRQRRGATIARLARVIPEIRDLRRLGSPALDICWVACGRLHGFFEEGLKPWDIAAAGLIASEAGARVGRFAPPPAGVPPDGLDSDHFLVADPGIFAALEALLATGRG